MAELLIDDRLFASDAGQTCLVGSRCERCGEVTFPVANACPRCGDEDVTIKVLPRRGTLWSWTVQTFPPKSPPFIGAGPTEDFVPFGVGYVELPGTVIVESRLTESDPSRLRIGMELELLLVPCGRNAAGDDVITYAFAPC